MDPISLAIGAIGLGISIFGGAKQSEDAAKASQISKDEASHEEQINQIKQQQMHVEANRMQLENVRNNQRARAMATNAAVNQGAQLGSGLAGGLAQINDQTLFNMQGVSQAESFGGQISSQNSAISGDKMQMADVNAQYSKDAGITSLGGAIMKSGPIIGQLSKGFGGGGSKGIGSLFMGGGSPSGY